MAIKFYTDTHIAKAVAVQLQQHGVDIIRCEDVGKENDSDEHHLEYAVQAGRTVVTCDRDFSHLHNEYLRQGKLHTGIFCVTDNPYSIGVIAKELLFWHEAVQAGAAILEQDVYNQIWFIRGL